MKTRNQEARVAKDKSEIVAKVPLACADERAAVDFLEEMRWGGEACCPCCGSIDVYQLKDRKTGNRNRRFLWDCRACRRQFTVRIGTVLEDSRIPLRHWCYGFWAACASKKGVSALQIKRQTGLTYKSALFLMHRIRYAMSDDAPARKLNGDVEADETYVGGKPRIKGKGKRPKWTDKTPVMALVERNGDARAMVVEKVTAKTVDAFLRANADRRDTLLLTDENKVYIRPGARFFAHETVNHRAKEYVRGDIHTNTVESFFSLIKRGMYGTFHSVSKKHLHRYVSEFQFRYNARKVDDGERTRMAIRGASGKRLRYKASLTGA